ncbi:hypothetical protein [Lysobacter enzymogenes]|nr:hypothetical protein [Lysobacter enzymogenes]
MDHSGHYVSPFMWPATAVLAGLLFTACHATQAKQSVAAGGPALPGAAHPVSKAAYPEPLRGTWMPKRMGCVPPDAQGRYEGEDLLYIGADLSGQYENTSKPLKVERVAGRPSAWAVVTTFSPGTGEYEGQEIVTYVLRDGELSIQTGDATAVYVRCRYKID